jgi:gamma-glutamyltranspeptidase/glutathione hydrolase
MGTSAIAVPRGVVVSPHHLASEAGAAVLASGGNAVDAAVAANLALSVVCPYYCGPGGDLLALVWEGRLVGYRSAGRAPAHLDAEVLRAEGHTTMPHGGPHTVTVPGAVRGWFDLLERFGSRSFGELARRAIELTEGFPLSRPGVFRLRSSIELALALHPASTVTRTYPEVELGAVVRQPGLGETLRLLAEDGPAAFYRGPIAEAIVAQVQGGGGRLDADDLAAHEAAWVEPIRQPFAGHEIVELPPPTQGVTALQMLTVAEGCDLGADDADRTHLLVEIAAQALEDRDRYVGDPDRMAVTVDDLLAPARLTERRQQLNPHRHVPSAPRPAADGGTAYLAAADADGLLVSLIQSNFTALGSGVHVAPWGLHLHNRGAGFVLDDDSPNQVGPHRLPLHTLIPAMVLREGVPAIVFGTMGGHAQAQIHLQLLVRWLCDGTELQQAITAPRWSVDPTADRLAIEDRLPWTDNLAAMGHRVHLLRSFDDAVGHAHAIAPLPQGYLAAVDPRAESSAAGC